MDQTGRLQYRVFLSVLSITSVFRSVSKSNNTFEEIIAANHHSGFIRVSDNIDFCIYKVSIERNYSYRCRTKIANNAISIYTYGK